MSFYVYMIISKHNDKILSYVGYTNNIENRIKQHNNSKGAKFTRGKIWRLIYFEKYHNKVEAMKNEYKLKKNYTLRKKIKKNFLIND